SVQILKDNLLVEKAEAVDAMYMSVKALRKFLEEEMEGARRARMLLSLHMKATMMKVSDPVIFGHAVTVYFKDAFAKHAEIFKEIGVNPNDGLSDVYKKIESLPFSIRSEIEEDLRACYEKRPEIAMVDFGRFS